MSMRSDVLKFRTLKEFFVFDTETTGLSPVNDNIIEFSAIKITAEADGSLTVGDKFDVFINPGTPIPEKITEITGITQEKIDRDGITPEDAIKKIVDFIGETPNLMGYNSVSFDEKFVRAFYERFGYSFNPAINLDVLKMAREKTEKPHKLSDIAQRFGVDSGIQFHTSIDDALATFLVYKEIAPLYDKPQNTTFKITKIARWNKASFNRLYINNADNVTVYYDINADEWCNFTDLPDEELIEEVYKFAGVASTSELLTKY